MKGEPLGGACFQPPSIGNGVINTTTRWTGHGCRSSAYNCGNVWINLIIVKYIFEIVLYLCSLTSYACARLCACVCINLHNPSIPFLKRTTFFSKHTYNNYLLTTGCGHKNAYNCRSSLSNIIYNYDRHDHKVSSVESHGYLVREMIHVSADRMERSRPLFEA